MSYTDRFLADYYQVPGLWKACESWLKPFGLRALEKSFADSIAGVHKLHLHSARGNVYCVTLIRPSLSIYVEDAEGCDHICILLDDT
jgi:hypothetical protein